MPREQPVLIHAWLAAAGHPWPALRIPRSGRRVGNSLPRLFHRQPKIKSRRGRNPDLRGFNQSADGNVSVSRVLAAGGREKPAMAGARPTQDRACPSEGGGCPAAGTPPPPPPAPA